MIQLDKIKSHLRITDDEEDVYLTALTQAAIKLFENETSRKLVPPRSLPKVVTNEIEIDELITVGILLTIGHWYENRESTTTESVRVLPMGVHSCWNPYRIFNIG